MAQAQGAGYITNPRDSMQRGNTPFQIVLLDGGSGCQTANVRSVHICTPAVLEIRVPKTAVTPKPFPSIVSLTPLANMIWNTARYVVGIGLSFFVSPFLIHTLGDAQYGVFALIVEITGYYMLADLGIRGAVGYFVARYAVTGELEHLQETAHAALSILAAASGVILLGSVGLAWLVPHWLKLEGVSVADVRQTILIMSATFAVSIPSAVFPAILYGMRRHDLTCGAEIVFRFLSAALAVITLRAGYGLVEFVTALAGATAVRRLIEGLLVWRLGLSFPLVPSRPRMEKIRDLLGYGVRNTTINVSQMIVEQLDLIVIASVLSTRWVTSFSIARSLIQYLGAFIATITVSLTPEFTRLFTMNKHEDMIRHYLRVTKLTSLLGAWLAAGLVVFGKPFLSLWVGAQYVQGDPLYRTDVVMVILTVGVLLRSMQSTAWQMLIGTRRLRYLTLVNLGEAALNLALSLVLARPLGLVGVALGTTIPQILAYGIALPVYMVRGYGLGWWSYLRQVAQPAILSAAGVAVPGQLLLQGWPPQTWGQLIGEAVAVSLVCALLVYGLALNTDERNYLHGKLVPRKAAPGEAS